MAFEPVHLTGVIGADRPRLEGADKVGGRTRYQSDHHLPDLAHACLATATIARGRVRAIDQSGLAALPGILTVLTHENVGEAIRSGKPPSEGGYHPAPAAPLGSDRVAFAGEVVAMVVAGTLEAAEAGVAALGISYEAEPAAASFDSPLATEVEPKSVAPTRLSSGDVEAALASAAVMVDQLYSTPPQHHNAMELYGVTCAWDGDRLTIWESSQNVRAFQHGVAEQLGIAPENVQVISPFIGGAFGGRGELGQSTAIVALAARRLGRPVKLVATRRQGFTQRTFRAETRHHLRLGADRDGRLTALDHESWELSSRAEPFALAASSQTCRLYACPNIRTAVHCVQADRQTPAYMRAPPTVPYLFALESAMDELSSALGMDPLELRRRNETAVDPIDGRPFTSRGLLRCIDAGAQAFGWSARDPRPGSMRDGGALIGWGYATSMYPAQIAPASCRITLSPGPRVLVETGTHEMGTGVNTVVAQTAADLLGLDTDVVEVRTGDSALPAAPLSAGSCSTASVCTVVAMAARRLATRLARDAAASAGGGLAAADPASIKLAGGALRAGDRAEPLAVAIERTGRGEAVVEEAANLPEGSPPDGVERIGRGKVALTGGAAGKQDLRFAFGAQFAEVRVDRWTGEVRASRLIGAYAAGRIVNRRTANSQMTGGQIWGLSSALLEATEVDPRTARYVNDSLSEYLVPVHADVGEVRAILLEEDDAAVNPLGIKGIGELGTSGVNAAVANAVHHATGVRVRDLPIRLEKLLESPFLA